MHEIADFWPAITPGVFQHVITPGVFQYVIYVLNNFIEA